MSKDKIMKKVFFLIWCQETKLWKNFFLLDLMPRDKITKKVLGLERCNDTNKIYIEFLDYGARRIICVWNIDLREVCMMFAEGSGITIMTIVACLREYAWVRANASVIMFWPCPRRLRDVSYKCAQSMYDVCRRLRYDGAYVRASCIKNVFT